jgi:hypothetical protein
MATPSPRTGIDKAVIRRINSLLDEGDDDEKVEIDANIFAADTVPTDVEVRNFWERHCNDLDFPSVRALLKAIMLQKRSVSVRFVYVNDICTLLTTSLCYFCYLDRT